MNLIMNATTRWITLHGSSCEMASGLARQMGFMASVLQARGVVGEDGELPEEFIGQALKSLTMHEVGHTLGLRHNFQSEYDTFA